MRKIIALLTGVVLLSAGGSAFAKQNACPDVWDIRENGSTLSTAFQYKDKIWIASSSPFISDDSIWQTHFIKSIPGVSDPSTALKIAQEDFNNSSMMTNPKVYNEEGPVICDYSPEGTNYHVLVVNGVDVGFKKFI